MPFFVTARWSCPRSDGYLRETDDRSHAHSPSAFFSRPKPIRHSFASVLPLQSLHLSPHSNPTALHSSEMRDKKVSLRTKPKPTPTPQNAFALEPRSSCPQPDILALGPPPPYTRHASRRIRLRRIWHRLSAKSNHGSATQSATLPELRYGIRRCWNLLQRTGICLAKILLWIMTAFAVAFMSLAIWIVFLSGMLLF